LAIEAKYQRNSEQWAVGSGQGNSEAVKQENREAEKHSVSPSLMQLCEE